MTQRLYVLPQLHISLAEGGSYNVPKYLPHRFNPPTAGLEGVEWAWVTYLLEDTGIVVADTTTAQNQVLIGFNDVLLIPPLGNTVPNVTARNKVRTILENSHVPGNWVTVGMTYRSILRVVLGVFQFHGRLVALTGKRVFDGSLNLDMTVAQIPANTRDRLAEVAGYFGLDYSTVTGATTIREMLRLMGAQFAGREFQIGEMVI